MKRLLVIMLIALTACAQPIVLDELIVKKLVLGEIEQSEKTEKDAKEKQAEPEKPGNPAIESLVIALRGNTKDQVILDLIEAYVAHDMDVTIMDPEDGWTTLHLVARTRPLSVIKAMVDAGADVAAKDESGELARMLVHYNEKLSTKEAGDAFILLGGTPASKGRQ